MTHTASGRDGTSVPSPWGLGEAWCLGVRIHQGRGPTAPDRGHWRRTLPAGLAFACGQECPPLNPSALAATSEQKPQVTTTAQGESQNNSHKAPTHKRGTHTHRTGTPTARRRHPRHTRQTAPRTHGTPDTHPHISSPLPGQGPMAGRHRRGPEDTEPAGDASISLYLTSIRVQGEAALPGVR